MQARNGPNALERAPMERKIPKIFPFSSPSPKIIGTIVNVVCELCK